MTTVTAWAAHSAGQPLQRISFDPGRIGADDVEIAVEHCGVCHSDLSMLDNEWGMTAYPLVPGHEATGRITAMGHHVQGLAIGQRVGAGWNAASCMTCHTCLTGDQHLCASVQPTIIGRHGAFASHLRVHHAWAVPLPDALPSNVAGPLLCGGITVFYPLLKHAVTPAQRVGVIGIGGLGHMALKFLHAWGCEVTAFTSSESKRAEAQALGAHRVVSTRDATAMKGIARSLDLIINTVNVALEWAAIMDTLAPKGRLHMAGALLQPLPLNVMGMILGEHSISGSPTGPRGAMDIMLAFAARHQIHPQVEHFPMSRVNDAMAHLRAGKARYRIVLDADFQ